MARRCRKIHAFWSTNCDEFHTVVCLRAHRTFAWRNVIPMGNLQRNFYNSLRVKWQRLPDDINFEHGRARDAPRTLSRNRGGRLRSSHSSAISHHYSNPVRWTNTSSARNETPGGAAIRTERRRRRRRRRVRWGSQRVYADPASGARAGHVGERAENSLPHRTPSSTNASTAPWKCGLRTRSNWMERGPLFCGGSSLSLRPRRVPAAVVSSGAFVCMWTSFLPGKWLKSEFNQSRLPRMW